MRSWTANLYIGYTDSWPDAVMATKTDGSGKKRYVPEEAAYTVPCTYVTADGKRFTKNKVLTYDELVARCRELEKQNNDLFGGYVDAITDSQEAADADLQEARERNHSLESENEKLRELVNALDWCTESFGKPDRCDCCPLRQSDATVPECEIWMKELKVNEAKEGQG